MTEKDFRKKITDLEINPSDKELINNIKDSLYKILSDKLINFTIVSFEKALSLKWNLYYHNEKEISFQLIVDAKNNKSYPLSNQALINEVYNIILYNYNIEKLNQIGYDESRNSIYFIDEIKINILLRFNQELEYQKEDLVRYDMLKDNFINLTARDFNLFKNAVILIKEVVNNNDIHLNTYMISLLLYYGLSINFTTHTYEAYLKEFNHALDDLLKGIKIDQDDQTYKALELTRMNVIKKPYIIVDIASPANNLCASFGEAFAQDMKKLKKLIQKMLEN